MKLEVFSITSEDGKYTEIDIEQNLSKVGCVRVNV